MFAPPTTPTAPDSPETAPVIAARRIPQALHQLSDDALRNIKGVFTDVDGTLTTRGKLPAQTYAALERLHRAGIKVVPVTGRSIAWCEVIARLWPVDAAIGENGAFAMRVDARGHLATDFVDDAQTRHRNLERIREVGAEILRAVPGSALASDQAWHAADLAIDHAEQVLPLPQSAVRHIVDIMRTHGMHATVSSIHVNGWFGKHDKLSASVALARRAFGVELHAEREHWVFVGDSANDAAMFEFFPLSVGVANVLDVIDTLPVPPAYLTSAEGGGGFAEVAERILGARAPALPAPRG
ncbi:HAD family hydrolase [Ralstonia sp. R-29]|uniref:HAD family hydrolase n=1 Tax=Ralstonia sp. R-29 TaxID=3404059 RepID=UPI003CF057F5